MLVIGTGSNWSSLISNFLCHQHLLAPQSNTLCVCYSGFHTSKIFMYIPQYVSMMPEFFQDDESNAWSLRDGLLQSMGLPMALISCSDCSDSRSHVTHDWHLRITTQHLLDTYLSTQYDAQKQCQASFICPVVVSHMIHVSQSTTDLNGEPLTLHHHHNHNHYASG